MSTDTPTDDLWQQHAKRVEYCLTFDRTAPRRFWPDAVDGPDIPDAYGEPGSRAPGDWFSGGAPRDDAPADQWFAHWGRLVVDEAVHEALEWFRVDGRLWLDPHGRHETLIYAATTELCRALAELAAEKTIP